jgi:hypothetical protein
MYVCMYVCVCMCNIVYKYYLRTVLKEFYVSNIVHYKTLNWRKITNKRTGIVYLFLKCIYLLSHRHVLDIP